MATDFNGIVSSGGFKPSTKNTPVDVRTRIESLSEIAIIPNPFVGMIFYVLDEEKFYVVKSLKAKDLGAMLIPDASIDEFEPLINEDFVTIGMLRDELANIDLTNTVFDILETEDKTILGAVNELLSMIKQKHPGAPEGSKIYYGYIPYEVHQGIINFRDIDENILLNENCVLQEAEPKILGEVSLGEIPEYALIVVAVPKAAELNVAKNNGIGSKVEFSDEIMGANGMLITIDEIEYLLYGEFAMISGERKVFID